MDAGTELVRMAKDQGLTSTCLDGLLKQVTRIVVGASPNEDMTEQLGYE
jgi:hypothetical protein